MDKKEINRLLSEICNSDGPSFNAYLIGGGALTWSLLQDSTKDLDFVVDNTDCLCSFVRCMEKIGFSTFLESKSSGFISEINLDKPVALIRGNQLIDVFHSRTTHFNLSPSMISRSLQVNFTNHKNISVLCPSDIFLLKSATGRPSDSKVLQKIFISFQVNWENIMSEIYVQIDLGNIRSSFDLLHALIESELISDIAIPRDFLNELILINSRLNQNYKLFVGGEI